MEDVFHPGQGGAQSRLLDAEADSKKMVHFEEVSRSQVRMRSRMPGEIAVRARRSLRALGEMV